MKIYTIGYEQRNIQAYIHELKLYKIDIIIDVREIAWSHKQQFCKKQFSQFLQENNIEYIHFPELGNPKKIRKLSNPKNILARYKSYFLKQYFVQQKLTEFIKEIKKLKKTACLTCFEKDYKNCHRLIITEFLANSVKNLKPFHIP